MRQALQGLSNPRDTPHNAPMDPLFRFPGASCVQTCTRELQHESSTRHAHGGNRAGTGAGGRAHAGTPSSDAKTRGAAALHGGHGRYPKEAKHREILGAPCRTRPGSNQRSAPRHGRRLRCSQRRARGRRAGAGSAGLLRANRRETSTLKGWDTHTAVRVGSRGGRGESALVTPLKFVWSPLPGRRAGGGASHVESRGSRPTVIG